MSLPVQLYLRYALSCDDGGVVYHNASAHTQTGGIRITCWPFLGDLSLPLPLTPTLPSSPPFTLPFPLEPLRYVEITRDGNNRDFIFKGDIKKAPGATLGSAPCSECILFTTDDTILNIIERYDHCDDDGRTVTPAGVNPAGGVNPGGVNSHQ